MIRRGVGIAVAWWILSATAIWAGPPAGEGPALDSAAPCGDASSYKSCLQHWKEWLTYHPAHCSNCGWCNNCHYAPPPLYTFFLDYGCNNDGSTCYGLSSGKACASKPCKP